VELYNRGNSQVDISGWVITWNGDSYTIPSGTTIAPGEFLTFDLGNINQSATVILEDDKGKEKDSTTFTSVPIGQGWGRYPDGFEGWLYTLPTKGSENEPALPLPYSDIVINEVYPDINGWVELYNKGDKVIDISGWRIIWSGGTFIIPFNTKIQKGEFLTFELNNILYNDTVVLTNENNLTLDAAFLGNVPSSYGWGRFPDGTGSWWVTVPTKGASNVIPEFNDVMVPIVCIFLLTAYFWSKGDSNKKAKLFKRRNS
jgi:hypothetical protein